ncbi:ribosome 60S biogenesis N-terminal-domain-containing protein [Hygrophoropsis aurantiaca]|uniref:Ribosome 60S biogenesis N-terminal-domain-containing protein n=1 Tax=Hygrophoropsis aurantiaca TaxID=72124 RepID=A0ACB8A1S4_9AGAM|nr:ribosome 60S biogenesis N-terminal-domain-containing protein [Hygrophoropsis aurantiaca]
MHRDNQNSERPQKRPKLDPKFQNTQKGFVFTNAYDIRQALQNPDGTTSTEALIALRNQFSLRQGEIVPPQDGRLLMVKQWLDLSPGGHDIFEVWDHIPTSQMAALALPVSLLSHILALLSSHLPYHFYGIPIIKTLLSPQWMRKLNSYIGGSHNELILVTLKLFNVMSAFGGGRERKMVLDTFHWESKVLPKLLHMRRKGKVDDQDMLARPDIRTLYLLFIMSFLDKDSSTTIKSIFLEQHREIFLGIFKGLVQDSYSVVRKILEVCWIGLWSDPKIKRTTKINLFSEITTMHLMKLYERAAPESANDEHVPADLVHHFLLAICTRPGQGICFKDKGWYPREIELETNPQRHDGHTSQRGGKIHNKILSNVLKSLKVNEDARQQELALKIMVACPELVASYWSGAALTLEPRLSSKWIANIAFFGSVISLSVPSTSFLIPGSDLYHPSPPPLSNILENVFPSVNIKAHFSKGLQSTSALVQHCTALALTKCLTKFSEVVRSFRLVEVALEENEEDGQWCKRRRELENEARRRVPDFQVIVAFSQQKLPQTAGATQLQSSVKTAFLSESSQRLLWLYHQCLPSLAAEAKFDVGKLLQIIGDFSSSGMIGDEDQEQQADGMNGLRTMKQLHLLRLLRESDQFAWSSKMVSSPHSHLHILLKTLSTTRISALRVTLRSLLWQILSQSILFQEDPEEIDLWLTSLPSTRRGLDSGTPDGTQLTDEVEGVIAFLDDCVQRCLKTPYRYFEGIQELSAQAVESAAKDEADNAANYADILPSPLLMTVIEQLGAKLATNLLSPSDTLSIFTFVRKLLFKISGKQQDLRLLLLISNKLRSFDAGNEVPTIKNAVQRELSILHACLGCPQITMAQNESSTDNAVQEFLSQVEKIPTPACSQTCIINAYELIDWVRLVNPKLHPTELQRLSSTIERFHKPALKELFENVHPTHHLLWSSLDLKSSFLYYCEELGFDWLFVQTSDADLSDPSCRDILIAALFSHHPSRVRVQQATQMIMHRLNLSNTTSALKRDILLLLAALMSRTVAVLDVVDSTRLKEFIFLRSHVIKSLCLSPSLRDLIQEGLSELINTSLDSASESDRKLVSPFCAYWADNFRSSATSRAQLSFLQINLWTRYMNPEDLLLILDLISSLGREGTSYPPMILALLDAVLSTMQSFSSADFPLKGRVGQLLTFRSVLPDSALLEDMIATAVVSSLPSCYDGRPLKPGLSSRSLASLTSSLRLRCHSSFNSISPENAVQSLVREHWTVSTASIVSALLYCAILPAQEYARWLNSMAFTTITTEQLAITVHAFVDSCNAEDLEAVNDEVIYDVLDRILPQRQCPSDLRQLCIDAVSSVVMHDVHRRASFTSIITKNLASASMDDNTPDYMTIAIRLRSIEDLNLLVSTFVDRGLQWAVRHIPGRDPQNEEIRMTLKRLVCLVKHEILLKNHYVEPFLTTAVQHCMSDSLVLELSVCVVQRSTLKPAMVNKYLQSILQHSQFFKVCKVQNHTSPQRDAVIWLLQVLFYSHPSNTCQISHIGPLARIYGGTLTISDRRLLSIFKLFENQKRIPVSSILIKWSPSSDITVTKPIDAVLNLDPIRMLRTCLVFPVSRKLVDNNDDHLSIIDDQVYDPSFVISLAAQMLFGYPPTSALGWVEVFRTNIVSLLIRSLSAKDPNLREAALCQIAGLWQCIKSSDMQEKYQILYVFDLLKNTLSSPSGDDVSRLPSFASLLLLHALRGIFYPSNFIYPPTARFLLQRPELDTTDVPMLYSMLYSNSDDWKKERSWIIRFLSDGAMSTGDWKILKRRHTWDLLASLFQHSERDQLLRSGILEILANLTCNTQATVSLILKSALLSWIEIQLQTCKQQEASAWLKIVENILIVGDIPKLERSTSGEWRAVLCRCVSLILETETGSSIPILKLAVSCILRLSLLEGPKQHLSTVIADALRYLERLEGSIDYHSNCHAGMLVDVPSRRLPAPHHAHGLHDPLLIVDPLLSWGEAVEELWRASMTLHEQWIGWDSLTSRLLIWRGLVGEDGSSVGEWARKEVVGNSRYSQITPR